MDRLINIGAEPVSFIIADNTTVDLSLAQLMSRYFHNVLVSVDQLANTLLAGYPDETLSARSWRCRDKKRWAIMVKVINFLAHNPHHCELAFTKEIDLPEGIYSHSWDKKY